MVLGILENHQAQAEYILYPDKRIDQWIDMYELGSIFRANFLEKKGFLRHLPKEFKDSSGKPLEFKESLDFMDRGVAWAPPADIGGLWVSNGSITDMKKSLVHPEEEGKLEEILFQDNMPIVYNNVVTGEVINPHTGTRKRLSETIEYKYLQRIRKEAGTEIILMVDIPAMNEEPKPPITITPELEKNIYPAVMDFYDLNGQTNIVGKVREIRMNFHKGKHPDLLRRIRNKYQLRANRKITTPAIG